MILRDKNANLGWTVLSDDAPGADDNTLEERRYYCQNWRSDVVALLESDGAVSEWIRYSAYGEATVYPFVNADYDGSGGVDGDDVIAFLADQDNNIAAADVDRTGAVDGDDVTAFYASWDNGWMSTAWTAGGGLPPGAGQLSVTSGNRIGYAGYQFDPATEQYHVRHRVYVPEMGRWTRRDLLGYVDGMGLMEYVGSRPEFATDPSGLISEACFACIAQLIAAGGATGAAVLACFFVTPPAFPACLWAAISALGAAASTIPACAQCARESETQIPAPQPVTIPMPPGLPIIRTPPSQRQSSPPPLWPSTCRSTSTNLTQCTACCIRNHGREVRSCQSAWLAAVSNCRCYFGYGCRLRAFERYVSCHKNSQWNYFDCITNCQARFPLDSTPSIPEIMPIDLVPPWIDQRDIDRTLNGSTKSGGCCGGIAIH